MSTKNAPKKKEGGTELPFDLEQQFIMRLPPSTADVLRKDIQSGSMMLRDALSIELHPDKRHGAIRYGTDFFNAKLVDLPNIIESHKTVDMKNFYKTADICQMLVTTTEEEAVQDENESPKKKDKDKKYQWNHGITPPLKNVKKRRFRKTLKKKYMEQPDIEKEVKRLFRTDAEAIDVKWEVVVEEEKSGGEPGGQTQLESGQESRAGTSTQLTRTDTAASLDVALFGELSSSEEEEEKDINIMDSGDEDASRDQFASQKSYLSLDSMVNSEGQDISEGEYNNELQSQLHELGQQLVDIEERMIQEEGMGEELDTSYIKEET